MEDKPQQNTPSKMEESAEPKELAGVAAAEATITEQTASNNDASQNIDEATRGESGVAPVEAAEPVAENPKNASETNSNEDQKVADWNRFAETTAGQEPRGGAIASGSGPSNNQQRSNPPGTVDWKKQAITSAKTLKGLRVELNQEKENSENIQKELDSAREENDLLTTQLSEAIQEISRLDPECHRILQQSIQELESKVRSLQTENEGLRAGTIVPDGQATGSKSERSAIQELDDNMGIDSDEEVDDFEIDDEGNERLGEDGDGNADEGNTDHEDETTGAEE